LQKAGSRQNEPQVEILVHIQSHKGTQGEPIGAKRRVTSRNPEKVHIHSKVDRGRWGKVALSGA
jgi:hypothetical protein